jgi:hypothetical protein
MYRGVVGLIMLGIIAGVIIYPAPGSTEEASILLARRSLPDVIAPPPPPETSPPPAAIPPPPPPLEMRRLQPPEDMREVAPPPDVETPPLGHSPKSATPLPLPYPPPLTGKQAKADTPELRVITIGVSNSSPKVGERVMVNASLRNSGATTIKGVKVRFFAGERQVGERNIDLPPGKSYTGARFIPESPGSLQMKVTLEAGSRNDLASATRRLKVTGEKKVTLAKMGEEDQSDLPPQRLPFRKPLLARKGTEFAKPPGGSSHGPDGRPPGSPPGGGGPPGLQDPTGGQSDPLGDWRKDLDSLFGGKSKHSMGDGIQGLHDQGDMPKFNLGSEKGGPDAGYYGGINPKYNRDQVGREISGYYLGLMMGNKVTKLGESGDYESVSGYLNRDELGDAFQYIVTAVTEGGMVEIYTKDKDGKTSYKEMSRENYIMIFGKDPVYGAPKKMPQPEGDTKSTPLGDPQLMLKLTRLAAKHQKGESLRPDAVVADPVPALGAKAASRAEGGAGFAAKGGKLAAAGATKAEAKWRFAGKKPGSEVTDPAEWQDRKIRDLSIGRIKHFEVIDPVEAPALQGALAQAQASGAAARSVTVAAVAGGVQKLTTQDGKQGWAPLKAGDKLSQGSIIRVDNSTGGEVGTGSLREALSVGWTKIHQASGHNLYQAKAIK